MRVNIICVPRLLAMTEIHKIMNLEAHTRYVKKFKSNTEAARQFLVDEGLKKVRNSKRSVNFVFCRCDPNGSR